MRLCFYAFNFVRCFSAIIGETLLKSLTGEENAALDGSERELHVFRDLVVFVTCHVHRERNAVFFGEILDSGSYFVYSERTFGSLET